MTTETLPAPAPPATRQRCPDFDEDCAGVENHARCAAGVVRFYRDVLVYTLPIIGHYCPYLETPHEAIP